MGVSGAVVSLVGGGQAGQGRALRARGKKQSIGTMRICYAYVVARTSRMSCCVHVPAPTDVRSNQKPVRAYILLSVGLGLGCMSAVREVV